MTIVTVTTVREAMIAVNCGVDVLVAHGPGAGGHGAMFNALAAPTFDPLDDLVADLIGRCECPVVAAGGLGTRADVYRLYNAGAAAVQIGTAFLLADEAGTNPVHRAALCDPRFTATVMTRAFTGRFGRTLRNRFTNAHGGDAICGFPRVAAMTAPLQAAALKIRDPDGVALWAGSAFRNVKMGSAADIVHRLIG
jgi:nitronate monooxygenase